mgnify:CR=1 FL=1
MTWKDIADCANVATRDTFGEAWEYRPPAGTPSYALTAVFDEPHLEIEFGADVIPHSASGPTLDLRLADLPVAPVTRATVTRVSDGKSWVVSDVERDGNGGALLRLLES